MTTIGTPRWREANASSNPIGSNVVGEEAGSRVALSAVATDASGFSPQRAYTPTKGGFWSDQASRPACNKDVFPVPEGPVTEKQVAVLAGKRVQVLVRVGDLSQSSPGNLQHSAMRGPDLPQFLKKRGH